MERLALQLGRLPADDQTYLLSIAERDRRTNPEHRVIRQIDVLRWIDTTDGAAFTLWLCLRQRETLEQVRALLGSCGPEERLEFARRRDMISGIDWMASADWPNSDDGDDALAPSFIPWRRIITDCVSNLMGWTFRDPAEMTLYHLRMLTAGKESMGGVQKMTPSDYEAFKARKEREGA